MRKVIVIFICLLASTGAGLLTRPSYILIGQLNWIDVITKGYNLSVLPKFFSQGMIDESFFWVMKFSAAGLILGIIVALILGGGKKSSAKKKKA
jgi:hypothetical protein